MKKIEAIKEIIRKNGGIAKASDFISAGIDRSYLSRLCKSGTIVRIRYGIYQLAENSEISEAKYISEIYPEGIVCLYSALFYYGYSDFTPREWTVAFPRTVSQRKMKTQLIPIKPYYYQNDLFNMGKISGDFDGTTLSVYDRERTICDCFKYRTKMDSEIFIKAVNSYALDKNKNLTSLSKYAKELKIYQKVIETMEVILNG